MASAILGQTISFSVSAGDVIYIDAGGVGSVNLYVGTKQVAQHSLSGAQRDITVLQDGTASIYLAGGACDYFVNKVEYGSDSMSRDQRKIAKGVVVASGNNIYKEDGSEIFPEVQYKPTNLTLLDFTSSDAATGWSTSANQTISYDATNKGLRIKGSGVSGTNIITTKTLPNTIPASVISRIAVKFRSNSPGVQAGLYIQLGNAGGTFSALNAAYSLFQISASDDPDWHWAVFQTSEDATFAGLGTLTQMRFRTNTQSAPFLNDVTIAKVVINPDTISPAVFTFDDGWDTAYTKAFPKLYSAGFKGTIFWPSSGASGVGADRRIDSTELFALKSAGWDISLDGTDDDSVLTAQASVDAAIQKFLKCQQVGALAGLTSEDFNYLCYPNGSAWISASPVQIAAATSNGTTTITLGSAATIPNGSAYYAANAPDGTTVVTGGTNVTSITVSQNVPAGTIAAATVDFSSVFSYNAITSRLSSAGVRGARLTSSGDNSIVEGLLNPLKTYAIGFTGKTLNQAISELTVLKNRGVPIVMYFHEIQDDPSGWTPNTANVSIHVYQSFFNGLVDLVQSWTDTKNAECLTYKQMVKKYTNLK